MKHLLFYISALLAGHSTTAQWQWGEKIIINKPVFENLYVTGGTVIIDAPVYGDLVAAGGTIMVNDSITKDVLLAGADVTINGYIGDDIRCAGGRLHLLKNVSGDIVITGGTIVIDKGIAVHNVTIAGGDVTINGTVLGRLNSSSGKLVLNGDAMRAIDCRGGSIAINARIHGPAILSATEKLTIGDQAFFAGEVRFWAPNDVNFKSSANPGQLIYDPSIRVNYARWYYLGFTSLVALLWYCGMVFVLILLLQYLFGVSMKRAGEAVYQSPFKSLALGAAYFVGIPVAAALAIVTIIGVPVALLLITAYIISILLTTVITSVVTVNWLNNLGNNNWSYWQLSFIGFALFIVLKIISLTPFFGWIIAMVITCMAFGAILSIIKWRRVNYSKE